MKDFLVEAAGEQLLVLISDLVWLYLGALEDVEVLDFSFDFTKAYDHNECHNGLDDGCDGEIVVN